LADSNIFKHGVEITLRGAYPDLLAYVAELERRPWKMYWGRLKLDAAEGEDTHMVLTLYTLSLEQAWLKL
jgi:MSHA biogenesis protein MshJ